MIFCHKRVSVHSTVVNCCIFSGYILVMRKAVTFPTVFLFRLSKAASSIYPDYKNLRSVFEEI